MSAIPDERPVGVSNMPIEASSTRPDQAIEAAARLATSLEPNERFRLIVRLWASLPDGHWAAPSLDELVEVDRRMREYEVGGRADMPWEVISRMVAKQRMGTSPASTPTQKLYSAPRRFDLFTIMIVTAAYALLLSSMSALRFPPIASVFVAAFITIVGVGQAVLFGGRQPRLASAVSGTVAYFVGWVCFALMEPSWGMGYMIIPGLLMSGILGSPLGYLAGVLVGGVFLVADVVRQRYGKEITDDGSMATYPTDVESLPSVHPLDDVPSTSP
jgi:hypothetical protein